MMRERPILFSGPMVRAILDGRKTQTRRAVKPQPPAKYRHLWPEFNSRGTAGPIGWFWSKETSGSGAEQQDLLGINPCPYGNVGDRLWIKTGYRTRFDDQNNSTTWSIDSGFVTTHGKPLSKTGKQKRDGNHTGMFMPFWLSQELALPWLEITGVRVERLQDISDEDVKSEGVVPDAATDHARGVFYTAFRHLWQSINGPESWSANPWVWVIEFRRVN